MPTEINHENFLLEPMGRAGQEQWLILKDIETLQILNNSQNARLRLAMLAIAVSVRRGSQTFV